MRPLYLRFSGLQSYREPQEIDFQRLTEVGLFGIFGPTGSGKSTILDAITLALYGRVERAGAGIQGIMNMNSDKLSVSFAFALGERLFRVERSYRRNKANVVSMTGARLIEQTGDQSKILADKDVTAQVRELLGLDVQDFTRAVVLPQGKFAEFLTLAGKERRNMLERLFGLAAYGKRLTERVGAQLAAAGGSLGQVTAQQQTLGDASERALSAAEKQQREAEAAAEAAAAALKAASAVFEEAKKQLELQEELKGVEEKAQAHKVQAPEMEEKAGELAASEQAEPLRHLLQGCQTTAEEVAAAQQRASEAAAEAVQCQGQAQRAQEEAEAAAAELKAKEPEYLLRLSQLEEALELERQQEAAAGEFKDLASELSRLQGSAAGLQAELMECGQKKTACEGKLADLEQARARLIVSAEERERLGKAGSELQALKLQTGSQEEAAAKCGRQRTELERLQNRLQEVQSRLAAVREEFQGRKAQMREHAQKLPASSSRLAEQGEELALARAVVVSLKRRLQERTGLERERCLWEAESAQSQEQARELTAQAAAAGDKLASLKAAAAQEEEAKLASMLASRLQAGEPCPVCGALHHPAPQESVQFRDYAPAVAQAERDLDRIKEELAKAAARGEAAAARSRELATRLAELDQAIAGERQQLPLPWQDREPEEELLQAEAAYQELKKQTALWEEERARLEAALAAESDELAGWERQEAALAAKAEAADASLKQRVSELAQAQELLTKTAASFAALAGGLDQAELEARLAQLAAWDRELERLERRKQQLTAELKEAAAQADSAASKLDENKVALAKLEIQRQERRQALEQLQERLRKITAGEAAGKLRASLHQSYEQLKTRGAVSGRRAEELRLRLQETQSEVARSAEALSGAQARLRTLEQGLAGGLEQSGFASKDSLASALREETERRRLRQQLEAYRQQAQLLVQEESRLRNLISEELTAEEYQRRSQLYSRAAQGSDEALAQMGAAQENYRQLQAKRQKWRELEEEFRLLTAKVNKLESLQAVLRGNVFVDFLAQEQLEAIAQDAAARLLRLSGGHYALEIGEDCDFQIVDHFSGSIRRPVNTLSGGETFLASLALALALSSHIQLRGAYPLEFFFLDEGFGTLDPELLETVITALEMLQKDRMIIGVISHVAELRQRLARRLYVEPAEPLGRGSRIRLEVG